MPNLLRYLDYFWNSFRIGYLMLQQKIDSRGHRMRTRMKKLNNATKGIFQISLSKMCTLK